MATSSIQFGTPKVFVRGGGEYEWTELGTVTMNETLCPAVADEFVSAWKKTIDNPPAQLSFTFTIRNGKRARIRLLQQAGFLDKPKCTYKTVKRFSAKRNRH